MEQDRGTRNRRKEYRKVARNRRKHSKTKGRVLAGVGLGILVLCVSGGMILKWYHDERSRKKPDQLLKEYVRHIEKKEYEAMYNMLSAESADISKEDFVKRNTNIYEGMEAQKLQISDMSMEKESAGKVVVSYKMSFETVAGPVEFSSESKWTKEDDSYGLLWEDEMILPGLQRTDKVRVSTSAAVRGQILDRNGVVLAGPGTATSVGMVPGELEDRDSAVQKVAELLQMDPESLEKKLDASWVKEDSFVPLATLSKVQELDLMSSQPDAKVLEEKSRQDSLTEIPGVHLSDTEVRSYGLGEAAAHLIGYVQGVTAEDLEKHPGEGYSSSSVIGKAGIEGLYEKELKGKDGYEICIMDEDGQQKEIIASSLKENGKDIKLTIDSSLQKALYEQFQEDKGCSAAMNPYTGEVLALVSTPSYDNNAYILGMTDAKWKELNEDENQPLYNRFRQVWCPGSTFKPITAAIGLQSGMLDANEDFGQEGLSWQKDESWGTYKVTTLHEYAPVTMENALIYSDNIYFAKAALKIGPDTLTESLDALGFGSELPFDIKMAQSQYSNSGEIESDIQLADSGYGQGQVLVNPLHLACIYTAFLNEGTVQKPYLRYRENPVGEAWISQAFSPETVSLVLKGMDGVVNNSHGTAYAAHREDFRLAGKTGTAELKASQEDTTGTEIGWFAVFTEEKEMEAPILLVSMVENVKGIGGSGYVVEKDRTVLEDYLGSNK